MSLKYQTSDGFTIDPETSEIDDLVELHAKTENRLRDELTDEQWQGVVEYVELEIQLQSLDGR